MIANHSIHAVFKPIPSFISGKKFHDLNGNGLKELTESGVADWKIILKKDGNEVARDTTDVAGSYHFDNLLDGKYIVREIQQNDWIQTSINPDTIMIVSNTHKDSVNFGNGHHGNICSVKYEDKNGNGNQDVGELTLQGWTILLGGTSTAFIQTDVNGHYCFNNLLPGYYIVSEAQQSGWKQTQGGF